VNPNERPCPDDLLVAARRRWLSDLERKALSAHLARCESCRAGERAAAILREPFADASAPSEADRALVERVAARASASLAKGAHRGGFGWRRVAVGVIAFLGLGGVASAWIGRAWVAPRAADRGAVVAAGSFVRPRVFRRNDLARAPETPPPVAPARPVAPPPRHVLARPIHDGAVAATPPETAASLFAAANAARREGDLRRAVAAYEALRTAFPDSAEARVSAISRGDLLLRLEEPARALRAFDAYLSQGGGGSLREEALFGRARCARKLGDAAAEQSSWARLVQEFPSSAYAPVARQRLDELLRQ
jgi:TolA-binding protein